jgi:hypothetical protein
VERVAREQHSPEGVEAPARIASASDRFVEIEPGPPLYAVLLGEWWRAIAVTTVIVAAVVGLVSKFVLPKWYQAVAVVKPVPEPAVESRVEGGVEALGGDLSALVGVRGDTDAVAEEYMTVLRSFAFNVAVAERHGLVKALLKGTKLRNAGVDSRRVKWAVYYILKDRLDVDYSLQTGNLTLYYEDRDPATAQRVLGYYLSDLRDRLRQRAIRDARAAVSSLQAEAKNSSDPLLAQNLYALIARQVEREKLAQVQADFAFKVLEPPVTPYRPHWPVARLNALLAAFLTAAIFAGAVLLFGRPRAGARAQDRRP